MVRTTLGGRVPEDAVAFEAAILDWYGKDVRPRIMVDSRLAVIWQNVASEALLASHPELEIVNGILTATARDQQAELAGFVAKAGSEITSWRLQRPDELGFLLLRAVRLAEKYVGLTAIRTGPDCKPRFLDLDKTFKLTGSEHRVLIGLLEGSDVETLARHHGVSIETTRTHIRNLYAKMGVNSRESLFALVLPFRQ